MNDSDQCNHDFKNHSPATEPALSFSIGKMIAMVRKGGFEPPRLSAPPPQDGVSASSTTSAGCKLHALNNLAISASQLRLHRILHRPFAFYTPLWRLQVREPHKQFLNGLLSRGCTERILVLMLSCPATYCNVKGSGYSSASGFRRGLMQAEESGQLRADIASVPDQVL